VHAWHSDEQGWARRTAPAGADSPRTTVRPARSQLRDGHVEKGFNHTGPIFASPGFDELIIQDIAMTALV
jgi:hypothetical protein